MKADCDAVVSMTNLREIDVSLVMNDHGEVERRMGAEYSSSCPGVLQVHRGSLALGKARLGQTWQA